MATPCKNVNAKTLKYVIIGLVLSSFKGDDCNFIADYYQTAYQAEIHYLTNNINKVLMYF